MNADADAEPGAAALQPRSLRPSLLDVLRGQRGLFGMVVAGVGKVEYGQNGVAHELVHHAIPLPDRIGALVIKAIEHIDDVLRRSVLGHRRVAAEVGEEDSRREDAPLLAIHPREERLADSA